VKEKYFLQGEGRNAHISLKHHTIGQGIKSPDLRIHQKVTKKIKLGRCRFKTPKGAKSNKPTLIGDDTF